MAVLLATMGYTPGLVVAPLRQRSDIREMHVFYGDAKDPERREPLQAVRKVSETFGVRLHEHSAKDGFDYDHFLCEFGRVRDKVPDGEEIIVNASSGPRPMIMAATIFCFLNDLPLWYYDEYDTKEGKVIHLRGLRMLAGLGERQRAILARLQEKGPADMSTLAKEFGLAASTLTSHIGILTRAGAVNVEHEGRRRIVELRPELNPVDFEALA